MGTRIASARVAVDMLANKFDDSNSIYLTNAEAGYLMSTLGSLIGYIEGMELGLGWREKYSGLWVQEKEI